MSDFQVGDRVPRLERAFVKILAEVSLRHSKKLGLSSFEWIEDDKHTITLRIGDMDIECAVIATVIKNGLEPKGGKP